VTESKAERNTAIVINGVQIPPGKRQRVSIPVARLPTETWMSLAVEVINGKLPGPRVWLNAAIHGDELNGIEIIHKVLETVDPTQLRGAIIAVPIVNVFGFINQERYLPDRRDLNRCFPGSAAGSLASRMAYLFMNEIVKPCSHGIDLHTGSNHRTNLPQIRTDLSDDATRRWAEAFGAPVMLNARSRSGSLRQAAAKIGKTVLLYEAGEPMRFDPFSVQCGVDGVNRAMAFLGMLPDNANREAPPVSALVEHSTWVRARRSGILRMEVGLGDRVADKQPLAGINDVYGSRCGNVRAPFAGVVIGHTNNPLVHQGDAVLHLARAEQQSG